MSKQSPTDTMSQTRVSQPQAEEESWHEISRTFKGAEAAPDQLKVAVVEDREASKTLLQLTWQGNTEDIPLPEDAYTQTVEATLKHDELKVRIARKNPGDTAMLKSKVLNPDISPRSIDVKVLDGSQSEPAQDTLEQDQSARAEQGVDEPTKSDYELAPLDHMAMPDTGYVAKGGTWNFGGVAPSSGEIGSRDIRLAESHVVAVPGKDKEVTEDPQEDASPDLSKESGKEVSIRADPSEIVQGRDIQAGHGSPEDVYIRVARAVTSKDDNTEDGIEGQAAPTTTGEQAGEGVGKDAVEQPAASEAAGEEAGEGLNKAVDGLSKEAGAWQAPSESQTGSVATGEEEGKGLGEGKDQGALTFTGEETCEGLEKAAPVGEEVGMAGPTPTGKASGERADDAVEPAPVGEEVGVVGPTTTGKDWGMGAREGEVEGLDRLPAGEEAGTAAPVTPGKELGEGAGKGTERSAPVGEEMGLAAPAPTGKDTGEGVGKGEAASAPVGEEVGMAVPTPTDDEQGERLGQAEVGKDVGDEQAAAMATGEEAGQSEAELAMVDSAALTTSGKESGKGLGDKAGAGLDEGAGERPAAPTDAGEQADEQLTAPTATGEEAEQLAEPSAGTETGAGLNEGVGEEVAAPVPSGEEGKWSGENVGEEQAAPTAAGEEGGDELAGPTADREEVVEGLGDDVEGLGEEAMAGLMDTPLVAEEATLAEPDAGGQVAGEGLERSEPVNEEVGQGLTRGVGSELAAAPAPDGADVGEALSEDAGKQSDAPTATEQAAGEQPDAPTATEPDAGRQPDAPAATEQAAGRQPDASSEQEPSHDVCKLSVTAASKQEMGEGWLGDQSVAPAATEQAAGEQPDAPAATEPDAGEQPDAPTTTEQASGEQPDASPATKPDAGEEAGAPTEQELSNDVGKLSVPAASQQEMGDGWLGDQSAAPATTEQAAGEQPDASAATEPDAGEQPDAPAATEQAAGEQPAAAAATEPDAGEQPDAPATNELAASEQPDAPAATEPDAGEQPDAPAATEPDAGEQPDAPTEQQPSKNEGKLSVPAASKQEMGEGWLGDQSAAPAATELDAGEQPDAPAATEPDAGEQADAPQTTELDAGEQPDASQASEPDAGEQPDAPQTTELDAGEQPDVPQTTERDAGEQPDAPTDTEQAKTDAATATDQNFGKHSAASTATEQDVGKGADEQSAAPAAIKQVAGDNQGMEGLGEEAVADVLKSLGAEEMTLADPSASGTKAGDALAGVQATDEGAGEGLKMEAAGAGEGEGAGEQLAALASAGEDLNKEIDSLVEEAGADLTAPTAIGEDVGEALGHKVDGPGEEAAAPTDAGEEAGEQLAAPTDVGEEAGKQVTAPTSAVDNKANEQLVARTAADDDKTSEPLSVPAASKQELGDGWLGDQSAAPAAATEQEGLSEGAGEQPDAPATTEQAAGEQPDAPPATELDAGEQPDAPTATEQAAGEQPDAPTATEQAAGEQPDAPTATEPDAGEEAGAPSEQEPSKNVGKLSVPAASKQEMGEGWLGDQSAAPAATNDDKASEQPAAPAASGQESGEVKSFEVEGLDKDLGQEEEGYAQDSQALGKDAKQAPAARTETYNLEPAGAPEEEVEYDEDYEDDYEYVDAEEGVEDFVDAQGIQHKGVDMTQEKVGLATKPVAAADRYPRADDATYEPSSNLKQKGTEEGEVCDVCDCNPCQCDKVAARRGVDFEMSGPETKQNQTRTRPGRDKLATRRRNPDAGSSRGQAKVPIGSRMTGYENYQKPDIHAAEAAEEYAAAILKTAGVPEGHKAKGATYTGGRDLGGVEELHLTSGKAQKPHALG